MTHNNAVWRSKHPTKKLSSVQPCEKKITVDITFAQFQRYLELLKLTNSQFRLRAAEVDRESEDTSGSERERNAPSARSSHHSANKPHAVITSSSCGQSRHLPGHGAAKTERVVPETVKSPHDEAKRGYPLRAGAAHVAAKGGTVARKCSKTSGVNKNITVVDSSRTCKQNPSGYCDKTPQPFTETLCPISKKPSILAGKHPPATKQYQTRRVDASAKIQLTRLDSNNNSTYDIEGYDDFRCLKGDVPVSRRPTAFTNAPLPPLFRDPTLPSRRDTQDTGMLLTTLNVLRARKTNVRFSDVTSVSMYSNAHCRRPSRWVAGNVNSRSSFSTASARMSVPSDTGRGREKQSIRRCRKPESVRWLFTTEPTPLRLYVSYYEPPAEKFVEGITANDGTPLLPVSRQHILRGMVYNRHTMSLHPPLPSSMKRGMILVRNAGRSRRESRASVSTKTVARPSMTDERPSQSRFKRASASVKVLGRMK